jgi:deoxyadenosine/deoxycytidine kinase
VPTPDLVIYLQTPTDVLQKRLQARERDPERPALRPDETYLRELNEAYNHFFFHYSATSLLVVEGSQFRPQDDDEALDDLVKQIKTMGRGTRYYVPRT